MNSGNSNAQYSEQELIRQYQQDVISELKEDSKKLLEIFKNLDDTNTGYMDIDKVRDILKARTKLKDEVIKKAMYIARSKVEQPAKIEEEFKNKNKSKKYFKINL